MQALICPIPTVIALTYSDSVVHCAGCHRDAEMTRAGTPSLFLDCQQMTGVGLRPSPASLFPSISSPHNSPLFILFNFSNHCHFTFYNFFFWFLLRLFLNVLPFTPLYVSLAQLLTLGTLWMLPNLFCHWHWSAARQMRQTKQLSSLSCDLKNWELIIPAFSASCENTHSVHTLLLRTSIFLRMLQAYAWISSIYGNSFSSATR